MCCDKYTTVRRTRVTCAVCRYCACTACVQRYLLSSYEDSHCMACRRPWTRDFLDSTLTRAFCLGPLKAHRENVLLDRERSMLPATQSQLERIKEDQRLVEQIAKLKARRRELKNMPVSEEASRRTFIMQCPAPKCRGFVSATSHKCGVCDAAVCPQCHELIPDGGGGAHVCDPNTLESVRMITRECRACPHPGCGALISRVSGCSQMWCTACNNAFDWKTGDPIRVDARLHNPHYFEFVAKQEEMAGRGGGSCGGGGVGPRFIPRSELVQALMMHKTVADVAARIALPQEVQDILRPPPNVRMTPWMCCVTKVLQLVQFARHIELVVLPTYGAPNTNMLVVNNDLRIMFLMNKIDEEQFKQRLQAREKKRVMHDAIFQVMDTVRNVMVDIILGIVHSAQPAQPAQATQATQVTQLMQAMQAMQAAQARNVVDVTLASLVTWEHLSTYSNTCLINVAERFACKVPTIQPGRDDAHMYTFFRM